MTTVQNHSLAGRREWTALTVLMLPLLLVSMDVSVLYFAVPFIARDLRPTATEQLWMLDVYGFVLAGLLLTMGALGDRIGRRLLLLCGAAAFSCASVAAAYANGPGQLIAARAVLGIAGATLMPSTLGLIRTMFPHERQRGKAIAIWTAVMSGGVALGPVLSGVLLEHFWWGSVFLINLPAMALLLILGPALLPEHRNRSAGRFDLPGSVLSLLAVLPIVWGVKEWAAQGLTAADVAAVLAGLVFAVAFAVRQRTAVHPMLDPALFRRPGFASGVVYNVVAMFGLIGNAVFFTQYLQSVLGMSPFESALWSVAPSVVVACAAPLAGTLAQRTSRAAVLCGGFAFAAAGFAVLSVVPASGGLPVALGGGSLLAAGLVVVLTIVTEVAMIAIESDRAGSATAVLETGSEFGGAVGIAVLGSIGAAVYRGRIGDALPDGLGADQAKAVRSSLANAVTVHGSSDLVDGVRVAARGAFVSGMHVACLVAAVVLAAAALSVRFTSARASRESPPDVSV